MKASTQNLVMSVKDAKVFALQLTDQSPIALEGLFAKSTWPEEFELIQQTWDWGVIELPDVVYLFEAFGISPTDTRSFIKITRTKVIEIKE